MFTVKIISIGKTKEAWLNTALLEYEKRLSPHMKIEWVIVKDEKDLKKQVKKTPFYICLDPNGTMMDSLKFSMAILDLQEKSGNKLSIVIGGATGIEKSILSNSKKNISFSALTLTHQMIRLLLLEQLYRGVQIDLNTGYHK